MASTLVNALVMHQRLRPVKHRFVYPVFMLKLDIDALSQSSKDLPNSAMFGINCWRPISIHTKDYGPRDGSSLKQWIQKVLSSHQVQEIEKIELLSFPRVFGYAFNPISIWYCYDKQTQLRAVLAEVNNTFGEHHFYLLRATEHEVIEKDTELMSTKMMHVSPFCEVKGHYQFKFSETTNRFKVNIDYYDGQATLLQTAIIGKTQQLTSGNLLKALCKQPLLTFGVFYRIHWHALILWLKKVPFHRQVHFTNQQISTGKTIKQEQIK
ncbi:DUF1365 domain-containing protein [Undibacterium fentianense]|uniref:DUF1365 domain-containing protein n=1 Tax=Undibacterium fentianense TaxID=2828728 RepID=A0A941IF14_9BURK|nr:DUF1365 domain-containing protein [Undibacterium fentianense]MBR7798600.1 DUF1365 domain-containing protein [Undibacterium fentianense]